MIDIYQHETEIISAVDGAQRPFVAQLQISPDQHHDWKLASLTAVV
jgi:hypothetical protein